jgi:integrase
MVIGNAMQYAVEMHLLPTNPVAGVTWTRPRTLKTVDPRVVVSPGQARRLLTEVRGIHPWGPRLEAFFGVMYYAALRPEEAVDLRRENLLTLPAEGWGEMLLTNSHPRSGTLWTNSGQSRERRALKHRADGDTRHVPVHPALVRMLRHHLATFGTGKGGRIFTGPRGGIVTEHVYLDVFHRARHLAFTRGEAASPLAEIPYQLRHACVSTWLNAGVPATQVAEWAGHSVAVLLRVYAKCIAGQQAEAKRRILGAQPEDAPDGPSDHRLKNATPEAPNASDDDGEGR